jgi:hypothetical protein
VSEIADLAVGDEVGERCERFVDVGVRVGAVDLVEVDPVGVQPSQGVLDAADGPPPRGTALVRVIAHREPDLGGEEHVVAFAVGECFADDHL